ncbi:SIR2 family protein [Bacillus sp. Brlt_9]|uniref:SIR2 family protein n=1 Tax=Bacillus sp. Brlt_9 TaxID=3110916 RepID=UPI003F7BA92F
MKTLDYTQTRLIRNIATDLLNHNTTFFIGAGFSIDLGYPSWAGLLNEIIEEYDLMTKIKDSSLVYLLSEKDDPNYKIINETIVKNLIGVDFLRLAGYVDLLLKEEKQTNIRNEITKKISTYELKRSINIEKFNNYRRIFSNISEYISEIITTNYDTNIEYCIDNLLPIHRNISSLNSQTRPANKDTIKLYKIHGCIRDNNKGIIITEKDYQEFSSSNKYIFHKLYSSFMENNIVFIGYSLYDPNIRGLLSEVIEEIKQNKEAKKKIYWVTRGEVNPLDKRFYQDMYSMQIIDEMEILDFFDSLIKSKDSKWNAMKSTKVEWKELTKELLQPAGLPDIEFNHIIIRALEDKIQFEVLDQTYQAFITNSSPRNIASKAFFSLISKLKSEEIETYDNKITDLLVTEDNHLLTIVDLIQKDDDIKKLLNTKNYKRILLESLISRAQSDKAFYQYEQYSKGLLDIYRTLSDSLDDLEKDFIEAFYRNYSYLTNTKTTGYAFESLKTVTNSLKYLNEDMILKILKRYPTTRKSSVQIEQIRALIESQFDTVRQNELRYQYLARQIIMEKLQRSVSNVLYKILTKERGIDFDYEMADELMIIGGYESQTSNGKVIVSENENELSITYNENSLIFKISPDFEKGEAALIIDDQTIEGINPNDIRGIITPIIEETFSKWGLLTQVTA